MTVNITEDAGSINDLLTIRGSAQHMRGPHGETANVNIFDFNFFIDADKYSQGSHKANPVTANPGHQITQHFDDYVATLSFDTVTNGFLDDITGYTLNVKGSHCASECPIPPELPEPSTLLLLESVQKLTA